MLAWLEHEINAMSVSDYQVMFLVLTIGIPALVYISFKAFKRFRFMDATATSLVRSAAQGHVELKGLGEWLPNGGIFSPFSKSRCVWYHCTIEKRKKSGKNTSWVNVSEETSDELFRLVDETGHCIIDPDHANVVPEHDVTWYGNNQSDFSNAPAASKWISLTSGRYRFRERLIRTASPIYALGWFSSFHTDITEEYIERQVEDLLRQWKLQPGRYLRQYDINQNNKLEGDEWRAVRADARKQVLEKINRENQAQHLLSKPSDSRLPYILSAVDEESLVKRKKWTAYGSISVAFLVFLTLLLLFSIRSPLMI